MEEWVYIKKIVKLFYKNISQKEREEKKNTNLN